MDYACFLLPMTSGKSRRLPKTTIYHGVQVAQAHLVGLFVMTPPYVGAGSPISISFRDETSGMVSETKPIEPAHGAEG